VLPLVEAGLESKGDGAHHKKGERNGLRETLSSASGFWSLKGGVLTGSGGGGKQFAVGDSVFRQRSKNRGKRGRRRSGRREAPDEDSEARGPGLSKKKVVRKGTCKEAGTCLWERGPATVFISEERAKRLISRGDWTKKPWKN